MCAPEKSCTCGLDVGAAQDRGMAAYEELQAAKMRQRPSVVYRPKMIKSDGLWIAFYGEDANISPSGKGETPEKAMADFDKNWVTVPPPCKDCNNSAADCICIPF